MPPAPDVVVVGAGTAGCVAAARLAERGARVTLVETGARHRRVALWSLAGAFDTTTSRGDDVELGAGRRVQTRRGIGFGGSSAVNGGYFLSPTPADLRRWHLAGGDEWRPDRLRALLAHEAGDPAAGARLSLESDVVPEPVSEAFVGACAELGIEPVEDLDDLDDLDGPDGAVVGPVRFTSRNGQRVDVADAYLGAEGSAAGVTVRESTIVRRVLIRAGRVVGVELDGADGPSVLRCDRVVLCAGALGTAEVLVRAGIGPRHVVRRAGVTPVVDLGGVGTRLSTHPYVDLSYVPTPAARREEPAPFLQFAAEVDDAEWGGVVEVMATRRPYGMATGADPDDERLHLRVTLMSSGRRWALGHGVSESGGVDIGPAEGFEGEDQADVAALAMAVRRVAELAASTRFAPVVERWCGPRSDQLATAPAAQAWVRRHLQLNYHWCASAPVGPVDDVWAVVDGRLRVHGVDGLWIGDVSVLPDTPSRGPAASAVLLGALAATSVD